VLRVRAENKRGKNWAGEPKAVEAEKRRKTTGEKRKKERARAGVKEKTKKSSLLVF
jgi:hypothetical protein